MGHSPNQSVYLSIYRILTSSKHAVSRTRSVSEGVATWLQRAAGSFELHTVLMDQKKVPH